MLPTGPTVASGLTRQWCHVTKVPLCGTNVTFAYLRDGADDQNDGDDDRKHGGDVEQHTEGVGF
jgi:hypothetical protein